MNKILCLLLPIILLAACEEEKTTGNAGYATESDTATTGSEADVMPSDTLFYAIQGFNKTSPGCQSDTANCASFISSFPLIEMRIHGKIADSVNNFIRSKIYRPLIGDKQANGINDLLEPYFAAYKTAREEAQKEGEEFISAWFFNRSFSVLENTPRIFTVEHSESSYAGGAHPNSFTLYYHFNPATGGRLAVADIFKPGYEKQLTQLGEKKFRKQMKLAAASNLEDEGFWFKDNVFALPNNFLLKENGIMFLYNPYEVGSYALGPIEIFFTYKEVETLLRDEFNPAKTDALKQQQAAAMQ